MPTDYVKAAVTGAWILGVGTLGFALGVASLVGWIVLALLSLGPPAVMLQLWRTPAPTMSESIRDEFR
jgi:hypothetical protein